LLKHALALSLALAASLAAAAPFEPRNEATFQAIVEATSAPNRDTRMRAAHALGAMARTDALPALKTLALDRFPTVRAAALRALANTLPAGASIEVALGVPVKDDALRSCALNAAAYLKFDQRDQLIKVALENGSALEKIAAVMALNLDSPDKARPLINKALNDTHPAVRAEAVRTIGNAADKEAQSLVLAAIADESFLLRVAACNALGKMKLASTIPAIAKASQDNHYRVRRAATEVFAAFPSSTIAATAVRDRLADTDYTVRVAACDSLRAIADPPSAAPLAARLTDETFEVRNAAEKALLAFDPDTTYKALVKYASAQTERDTRYRAWHILGEYAHPATADMALDVFYDMHVNGFATRILRKLDDRRMIPDLKKVLVMPASIDSIVNDMQLAEGFIAAGRFGMREPIAFARGCLKRTLRPPRSEEAFIPSGDLTAEAARYLGVIGDSDSVDLMLDLFEKKKDFSVVAEGIRDAIKMLIGEELQITPPKERNWRVFFIDVKE